MNPPSRRALLRRGTVAVCALAAFAAAPAAAEAACAPTSADTVFEAFGDHALYSPLSGGTFEAGTAGWSLPGAAVAPGNDPFAIGGVQGTRSLSLGRTGVAVSPTFCVGAEHPTFRFFARRTSGTWGTLLAKLRWKGTDGRVNETTLGSVRGDTAWQLTPPIQLAAVLPLSRSGQSLDVQLVLDPEDYGGDWAIDDIYIDPRCR